MGCGRRLLWWDALDTLYFVGYALSTYVRAPFLFSQDGFHVASASVATFGGETWSKLRVTFPPDEPTHCRTQAYYLDATHLIRRVDYVAEPIGRWARAAHFCTGYREWRGLRVPTDRWVVPRTRDDRVWSWPPLVQIRVTAVRPILATMRVQTDEAARSTAANVLRRPLRVEETAATVAWVASDLASGVAGQVVNVCAGAIVSR